MTVSRDSSSIIISSVGLRGRDGAHRPRRSRRRLSAKGYGATQPIADNRTEDGRGKNRRVELVRK